MCLSTLVTATGDELTVAWTPPTPQSSEGALVIAAKCGCAATVSIRFLMLAIHGSSWSTATIVPSAQNCAGHAGKLPSRVRPLTLFLSLATLEVMTGATGLPPSVVSVPTPTSRNGRYRSRKQI